MYTPGWRGTVKEKCLAQELNTKTLTWALAQTAQSGIQHTNYYLIIINKVIVTALISAVI